MDAGMCTDCALKWEKRAHFPNFLLKIKDMGIILTCKRTHLKQGSVGSSPESLDCLISCILVNIYAPIYDGNVCEEKIQNLKIKLFFPSEGQLGQNDQMGCCLGNFSPNLCTWENKKWHLPVVDLPGKTTTTKQHEHQKNYCMFCVQVPKYSKRHCW